MVFGVTYQLIQTTMPIEVFITLAFIPVILVVIGFIRTPKIPALIVCGGLVFFLLAVMASQIQMGNLVASSVVSGTTTTYNYTPDLFQNTAVVEMLFALLGAIIIFFGGMLTYLD